MKIMVLLGLCKKCNSGDAFMKNLSEYRYSLSVLGMGSLSEDHVYFFDYDLNLGFYRGFDINAINTETELNLPVGMFSADDISIRNRRRGDKFCVSIYDRKSLSDFFDEHKVPVNLRDTIPLLCYKGEVLWVIGYGAIKFNKHFDEYYRIVLEN